MRRLHRVLLEIFGPPFLGTTYFVIISGIINAAHGKARFSDSLLAVPFILFFAYLLAGIPSLIYTVIMEIAFSLGMKPNSVRTFVLSGFQGLSTGYCIGSGLNDYWFLEGIGLAVGLTISGIIMNRSRTTLVSTG